MASWWSGPLGRASVAAFPVFLSLFLEEDGASPCMVCGPLAPSGFPGGIALGIFVFLFFESEVAVSFLGVSVFSSDHPVCPFTGAPRVAVLFGDLDRQACPFVAYRKTFRGPLAFFSR